METTTLGDGSTWATLCGYSLTAPPTLTRPPEHHSPLLQDLQSPTCTVKIHLQRSHKLRTPSQLHNCNFFSHESGSGRNRVCT
ncbi:hypothetical protein Hamer_G016283 [Homarus americanus]|uniref:Uncharacterized protein n=1 Tax=Homarus americanus TaxID=6706 RepID=A0A8J5JXH3_HOMAM|nr:hypothetical protein Hamer_G016283 [Homarus americanus]